MQRRVMSGFALPIVMIICVLASSLLVYDLQRMQAQAGLSRLVTVKQQAKALFEIEGRDFIETMNRQLFAHHCEIVDVQSARHGCEINPSEHDDQFQFQGRRLTLNRSFQESHLIDTLSYWVLTMTTTIEFDHHPLSWQRHAYITLRENDAGLAILVRSQLVRSL